MPPKPYYHEHALTLGDETYRLVINFEAIDATESRAGNRRYDIMLEEFLRDEATVGTQAHLLWGMLREHHAEITPAIAAAMMRLPGASSRIGFAMHQLITTAFPAKEEGPPPKHKNPPKPRGASKPSTNRGASRTA